MESILDRLQDFSFTKRSAIPMFYVTVQRFCYGQWNEQVRLSIIVGLYTQAHCYMDRQEQRNDYTIMGCRSALGALGKQTLQECMRECMQYFQPRNMGMLEYGMREYGMREHGMWEHGMWERGMRVCGYAGIVYDSFKCYHQVSHQILVLC